MSLYVCVVSSGVVGCRYVVRKAYDRLRDEVCDSPSPMCKKTGRCRAEEFERVPTSRLYTDGRPAYEGARAKAEDVLALLEDVGIVDNDEGECQIDACSTEGGADARGRQT